jgi:Ca2+/Na+ antiporter
VLLLFLTLFAAVGLLHANKWILNPKVGIAFLVVYALFVVFASALEFNLMGMVNPPTCPVPDA